MADDKHAALDARLPAIERQLDSAFDEIDGLKALVGGHMHPQWPGLMARTPLLLGPRMPLAIQPLPTTIFHLTLTDEPCGAATTVFNVANNAALFFVLENQGRAGRDCEVEMFAQRGGAQLPGSTTGRLATGAPARGVGPVNVQAGDVVIVQCHPGGSNRARCSYTAQINR